MLVEYWEEQSQRTGVRGADLGGLMLGCALAAWREVGLLAWSSGTIENAVWIQSLGRQGKRRKETRFVHQSSVPWVQGSPS